MSIIPFQGVYPKIHESCLITDGTYIVGDVEIGEGSSVWFGSVIRGDVNYIRIGKKVSVQDGTIIHVTNTKYPTVIGDKVVIGHRAVIHGCKIGSNVLIGMGAVIMDGAEIGDNCIIAAGSLVTQNTIIPDNSVVMGHPAKIKSTASEEILKKVSEGIKNYESVIKKYKKDAEKLEEEKGSQYLP